MNGNRTVMILDVTTNLNFINKVEGFVPGKCVNVGFKLCDVYLWERALW